MWTVQKDKDGDTKKCSKDWKPLQTVQKDKPNNKIEAKAASKCFTGAGKMSDIKIMDIPLPSLLDSANDDLGSCIAISLSEVEFPVQFP